MVVAEQKPREVIQYMVQTGHDQQAIEYAVGKQADATGAEHRMAEGIHAACKHRPAKAERRGDQYTHAARHDRDEASPAKEGQVAR